MGFKRRQITRLLFPASGQAHSSLRFLCTVPAMISFQSIIHRVYASFCKDNAKRKDLSPIVAGAPLIRLNRGPASLLIVLLLLSVPPLPIPILLV